MWWQIIFHNPVWANGPFKSLKMRSRAFRAHAHKTQKSTNRSFRNDQEMQNDRSYQQWGGARETGEITRSSWSVMGDQFSNRSSNSTGPLTKTLSASRVCPAAQNQEHRRVAWVPLWCWEWCWVCSTAWEVRTAPTIRKQNTRQAIIRGEIRFILTIHVRIYCSLPWVTDLSVSLQPRKMWWFPTMPVFMGPERSKFGTFRRSELFVKTRLLSAPILIVEE